MRHRVQVRSSRQENHSGFNKKAPGKYAVPLSDTAKDKEIRKLRVQLAELQKQRLSGL